MSQGFFPFEYYIYSTNEKEYEDDVKKKNCICKYISVLMVDPNDIIALKKLTNTLYYIRNTFCKDAFLYFFLHKFDADERRLVSRVVFDIFIKTNEGEVGEQKDYYNYCFEVLGDIDYENTIISNNWKKLCSL